MRIKTEMLAYEIALGVSLIGVVMCYGTLDLGLMVERQGGLLFGWLPNWGVFYQPLSCLIFMTAALAETKRVPFDLPEAEPEIGPLSSSPSAPTTAVSPLMDTELPNSRASSLVVTFAC